MKLSNNFKMGSRLVRKTENDEVSSRDDFIFQFVICALVFTREKYVYTNCFSVVLNSVVSANVFFYMCLSNTFCVLQCTACLWIFNANF